MSPTHLTSSPRLLLFPQVGPAEAAGARPAVRRYTLTLLPGRQGGPAVAAGAGKPRRAA